VRGYDRSRPAFYQFQRAFVSDRRDRDYGERLLFENKFQSGEHGVSGRQAVVREDDCPSGEPGKRSGFPVDLVSPQNFFMGFGFGQVNIVLAQAEFRG